MTALPLETDDANCKAKNVVRTSERLQSQSEAGQEGRKSSYNSELSSTCPPLPKPLTPAEFVTPVFPRVLWNRCSGHFFFFRAQQTQLLTVFVSRRCSVFFSTEDSLHQTPSAFSWKELCLGRHGHSPKCRAPQRHCQSQGKQGNTELPARGQGEAFYIIINCTMLQRRNKLVKQTRGFPARRLEKKISTRTIVVPKQSVCLSGDGEEDSWTRNPA